MPRKRIFFRTGLSSRPLEAATHSKPNLRLMTAAALLSAAAIAILMLSGCALSGGSDEEQSSGGNFLNQIGALAIGDAQVLDFANGRAEIQFENPSANEHFILAISGGLSGASIQINEGGGSTSALLAPLAPPPIAPNPAPTAEAATHAWFLDQQWRHAGQVPASAYQSLGGTYLGLGGGSQTFTVNPQAPVSVTADLIGSSTHVNVYLDNTADALSSQLKTEITDKLEAVTAQLIGAFGQPTDIDGNNRVNFLLTDNLPGVSGYFYSGDLNPSDPVGNDQEIVFLVAPDTSTYYGGTIPLAKMPGVLAGIGAHEFQHLLNFINHSSPEDQTINESISHAVENWVGYPHELRWKQDQCLPDVSSVNLGGGSIGIPERGCGELLIEHICETSGNVSDCLANLATTSGSGWGNLAQVLGGDLGKPVAEFLAGLVLTGSNLRTTPSAFDFKPISVGPDGDDVGFDPYFTYNDVYQTSLDGVDITDAMSLPKTVSISGFAQFFEITGGTDLSIQVSGNNTAGYAGGAAGVLIRVSDQGAQAVGKK